VRQDWHCQESNEIHVTLSHASLWDRRALKIDHVWLVVGWVLDEIARRRRYRLLLLGKILQHLKLLSATRRCGRRDNAVMVSGVDRDLARRRRCDAGFEGFDGTCSRSILPAFLTESAQSR